MRWWHEAIPVDASGNVRVCGDRHAPRRAPFGHWTDGRVHFANEQRTVNERAQHTEPHQRHLT
jgi:hypothetical protein